MSTLLSGRSIETWYGPINAIRNINISVEAGRIVTILGANGAGKTTLLNTIAGVIDPIKGNILFNDAPIQGLSPDVVASMGVVLVPEGRQVFPHLTVNENLLMGAFCRSDDTAGVSRDLEHVFDLFPVLKDRRRQPGGLMSGGEQQMLAIGRALMSRPKLLMMDEPSLGLSPLMTREIFRIIRRINIEAGVTILVVEQNATIALANAHDGYIMELGRIVAADTCENLIKRDDVKKYYLGLGSHEKHGDIPRWQRRAAWR